MPLCHSRPRALALAAALLSVTCGGGSSVGPSPIVTPTAAPSTPTPAPPASTLSACERIGYGDPQAQCSKGRAELSGEVSSAIDRLLTKQPRLFDRGSVSPGGDPRVIDSVGYYEGLIAELDAAGVCAEQRPDTMMVRVKKSNDSSEEFQPLTSQSFPWRGQGSFVSSCSPASFPRAPIDHIDYIFVTAYGFFCDPPMDPLPAKGPKPVLPMACDATVTATPKTFDHVDVPMTVHGPDVEWELVQGDAVIRQWDWQPFNVTVYPRSVGPLMLCATVRGVRGCLSGQIVP